MSFRKRCLHLNSRPLTFLTRYPCTPSGPGPGDFQFDSLNACFLNLFIVTLPRTGGSLGCAPGCDAGGREFVTPTGPILRVFK